MDGFEPVEICLGLALIAVGYAFYTRLRAKRKEVALVFGSLLFTLIVFEVALALSYPHVHDFYKLFQPDSVLGWRFVPNESVAVSYVGEAHHYIQTNEDGFRDRSFHEATPGNKRIMVIGDSFASNVAVRQEDVFTTIMERGLNATAVHNLGVDGYGQVQEYLLMRQQMKQIRPDLVIVLIYIRNDFSDNLGHLSAYPRPYASLGGDLPRLLLHPVPSAEYASGSVHSSWFSYPSTHTYHFIRHRLRLILDRWANDPVPHSISLSTPPELYLCRKDSTQKRETMFQVTEQLLLEMARFAGGSDVPILFVTAPSMVQVEERLWDQLVRSYDLDKDQYDRALPNRRLSTFARNHDMEMLDLLPFLQSEPLGDIRLYHERQQHWTRAGNGVVAKAVLDHLRKWWPPLKRTS